jgi:hypothetical protein
VSLCVGERESASTTIRSISGFVCHPFITKTHLSYSFLFLKLPPPPCAVLLVKRFMNHQLTNNHLHYSLLIMSHLFLGGHRGVAFKGRHHRAWVQCNLAEAFRTLAAGFIGLGFKGGASKNTGNWWLWMIMVGLEKRLTVYDSGIWYTVYPMVYTNPQTRICWRPLSSTTRDVGPCSLKHGHVGMGQWQMD